LKIKEVKTPRKTKESFFLNWDESYNLSTAEVGGKGQNLGRLYRYGFPVPIGGVLSARAYQDFLQHNSLEDAIKSVASIKAEEVMANEEILIKIRRKIDEGNISQTVMKEMAEKLASMKLLDKPVAVRSSATAEDSVTASFAGIHESFLNVMGLEQICKAVKGCYASLWTPRAVAYRRKLGIGDDEVAAAVVIMELVSAVAAGVAFSCDPRTGRRDRLVINANFGLGESVVSGAVEPDEYLLQPTKATLEIIGKKIGSKKRYTKLRQGEGTELVSTSVDDDKRVVLSDKQITELGFLILRVCEALGEGVIHQDVEWVFDGNKFVLVQARPVTSLSTPTFKEIAGQPVIWSNGNIKDVIPMVVTTASRSYLSGLNMLIKPPLEAAGYEVPDEIPLVRFYQGRVYFNFSAIQWGYYDAFGVRPAETNMAWGGLQPEIKVPVGNPYKGLVGIKRLWRGLHYLINLSRTRHSAEKIFKDMWETVESWKKLNFSTMTELELISHFSEALAKTHKYLSMFLMLGAASNTPLIQLTWGLEKDFPGRGHALANGLLAGGEEITSAEQGYRLMELATTVRGEEATRKYFESEPFRPSAWRDEIPEGSQFRKEFEEFLKDYGHRGVDEVELQNPRWGEDPSYLLEIVRAEALSPCDIDYRTIQVTKCKDAEKEIATKLKWSLSKLRVSRLIKQARKGASLREMSKSIMVKPAEVIRLELQEMGNRLVKRGILDEQSDVYHCAFHELAAILNGYWNGTGLKILVADRKQRRGELSQKEAPDVIIDEAPQPMTKTHEAHGRVLIGIGVAAGKASGPARLIHHPREHSRLQAGDVLVAPSTDPGWTPLFLRAKAVVMEVGGYVSHGAIVAREYGIPAVVNVGEVMKTLHDGEQLTVDGDEGKVYRETDEGHA